jgi:uroporphyrin-III C-methyltransferase
LTVKAVRLLRAADVVLHDDLVSPEILRLAPSTAQIHNVGKRCGSRQIKQEQLNFLMIAMAEAGLRVVRLKGGDPLIFGRAGEEIEALRRAGIAYEVVSGVTSALGSAAAAGMSLTHRDISSAVVLLTFQQAPEHDDIDWGRLVASKATLVIYMPGRNYAAVSRRLATAGLAPETPCLIVSRATTPSQQIDKTTLLDLPQVAGLPAPSLLIVGEVVRQARDFANAITPLLNQFAHQAVAPATEEQIA